MLEEDEKSFFEEPDFQETLKRYEEARQNGIPLYMDADELTDVAEYYMTREREEEASEAIKLALDLHPDSVDPQVFLARQQMFHDHIREAHEICDAITDKEDREVKFLRAELFIREEKIEEAAQFLEESYEKMDSDRANFIYDSAGLFMDYALWDQAYSFAKRLCHDFPSYRKGPLLMAEVLFAKGEYAQAVTQLEEILNTNPYLVNAWNLLAESQMELEHYPEALESAEYVLAINQENRRALVTKGNCLYHLKRPQEAHALYQDYLRNWPKDSVAYYMDAVCLAEMDQDTEAAAQLDKANEVGEGMSPEQFKIYLYQVLVESRLHHVDRALNALKKAYELAPKDTPFEYDFLMGRVLLENDKLAEAQLCFHQEYLFSKDRRGLLLRMAICYADLKQYALALHTLQDLVHNYGEDALSDALPYMAYCYFRMGPKNSFLKVLKQAAELNPQTTAEIFSRYFPGEPRDYYDYAYQTIYGRFPDPEEDLNS